MSMFQPILLAPLALWGIREPFSALSHLGGAALGVIGLVLLLARARRNGLDAPAQAHLALYAVSMTLTFAASALFHFPDRPFEDLELLLKLDHAAIFLFIAGTATAVHRAAPGPETAQRIRLTWGVALTGLALMMTVWPVDLWPSALLYLTVGALATALFLPVARRLGWRRMRGPGAGLVILAVSAIVFATGRPVLWPGYVEAHEVFHVLVLAGTALHYRFIYRRCVRPLPYTEAARAAAWRASTPVRPYASKA